MSVDEIRKLAKVCDVFADMACDNAKDPEGAIELYENMQQAFLDYAAMIERCEKLRLNMIPHRHDIEIVDYILRGDTGKEAK